MFPDLPDCMPTFQAALGPAQRRNQHAAVHAPILFHLKGLVPGVSTAASSV